MKPASTRDRNASSLTSVDLGMNRFTPQAIADLGQQLVDAVVRPVTIEVVTVMGSKSRLNQN